MIHLACLRGVIGYWTYYSTVIKVKDIVSNNRIITVTESEELYTTNINRILQREIRQSRIKSISNYIEGNEERFFSSLIVAIHRGTPKWTDIKLFERAQAELGELDEHDIELLGSKYGILTLTGDEQIFALDGQHRLKGIRKAFTNKPEIAELEIPVIFVIHKHDFVDKTRRLFTVLNKYAEKPRGAELIILDEDDVAAINARRLVREHSILSKENSLSTSKTGAISVNDSTSFTTLVTIYNINKKLYNKGKDFYTKRPTETDISLLYEKSTEFWDFFINAFPAINSYIDGDCEAKIANIRINRNDSTGGSLLLRPVGQELLANAFIKFNSSEHEELKAKLRLINFNLSSENWIYLFWNQKMLGKENKLKQNLLLFILGKYENDDEIHSEMSRIYSLNNQVYSNHIAPVELP